MRLNMTSTRLVILLNAFDNKHGECQTSGASETFDLVCLREDGFIYPYSSSRPITVTTDLGDRVVEAILEAIQKIEIKEQL